MNKKIVFFLISMLFLTSNVFAATQMQNFVNRSANTRRTSAELSSDSMLIDDISQPRSGVPAGFIMAFPINGLPNNPDWLECDGRSVPVDSDLYRMGVRNTPNLYAGNGSGGVFLRAGKTPGRLVADTLGSHNHEQPAHTHEWSGQLSSTAVSASTGAGGNARIPIDTGKNISDIAWDAAWNNWRTIGVRANGNYPALGNTWRANFYNIVNSNQYLIGNLGLNQFLAGNVNWSGGGWDGNRERSAGIHYGDETWFNNGFYESEMIPGSTKLWKLGGGGSTIGNVNLSGKVQGALAYSGNDATYYTGNAETAPVHYTTRYFIKIND